MTDARLRHPVAVHARLLAVIAPLVLLACAHVLQRSLVAPDAAHTLDSKAPFLKVHMRDGHLYVLSPWTTDSGNRRVTGTGTRYDVRRQPLDSGAFSVSLDSIVLFETNVSRPEGPVASLAIITGITAAIATACAFNPKACFGSCPTFYVTDGVRDVLHAEGFSASVTPSLEARDVDALFRARPRGREVRLDMVNEAWETHVVRFANLLAVPRRDGRVLSDLAGGYWSVTDPVPPTRCVAPEGNCTATVAAFDESERTSAADSLDLATREWIELVFDTPMPRPALVIASRQSLLPTYLLYQTFAFLGSTVGQWMATFERADTATLWRTKNLVAVLGGIDVLVPNGSGGWDSLATIRETGPLASDVRLIRLPNAAAPMRVRLRMAKGAWRIDLAALTSLRDSVTPIRVAPAEVLLPNGTAALEARARLTNGKALVTFPGDRYTLVYRLPEAASRYELFLETKGYYLEWMRKEWFAEENLVRAAELFLNPEGALRRLALEFKREEPYLEAAFWRSKYVRP